MEPEINTEFVRGTSLWRDAWRRLLKNKLAVFGLIVVAFVTIASLIGPTVIKRAFGFTPDYIPTNDIRLIRSFPPFTGPNGEFSWAHPMGTDNAGRDQFARVLQGGQISLFVGRSEEHTSELQSPCNLVFRLLLENKIL